MNGIFNYPADVNLQLGVIHISGNFYPNLFIILILHLKMIFPRP